MDRWLISLLAYFLAGYAQAQAFPVDGPPGQRGKHIVFIASDFRNGGVVGVYRGFEEAAHKLGWQVRIDDGEGNPSVQAERLRKAIAERPHGLVFGGFDPKDFETLVASAKSTNIALVGWHASELSGPTKDLFANVTTRPEDVGKVAVDYIIKDAISHQRNVGVVIFNDSQYAVANAKTEAMSKAVESCAGYQRCKLLSVRDVAIAEAHEAIPEIVPRLVATYGAAWTYTLAINDIYFDEINFPLIEAKRTDIVNVSAGDGSKKAIGRIASGISQQSATVAEPVRLQGYQLADELNRAFSGTPPSGFQTKPTLITTELAKAEKSHEAYAAHGFEAAYTAIWMRQRGVGTARGDPRGRTAEENNVAP